MSKLIRIILVLLAVALLSGCQAPRPTATPPPPTQAPAAPAGPAILTVKGKVAKELPLSLEAFKALGMTKITAEHPKKGAQNYEGVFLKTLLDKAGVQSGAAEVVFTASDGFSGKAALADLTKCDQCLVALGEDGKLSTVLPGQASSLWVKDVVTIEIK